MSTSNGKDEVATSTGTPATARVVLEEERAVSPRRTAGSRLGGHRASKQRTGKASISLEGGCRRVQLLGVRKAEKKRSGPN